MPIQRRVITPVTEQREVVIVRPRRSASLYAILGAVTLGAVGLIGYMAYAIYNDGRMEPEPTTTAVIIERRDGRAQRMSQPPQTIIVNPPPVIQMTPPVATPPPVKQPDTPIIVNGAPQTEEPEPRPKNRTEEPPPENIDEPPADPE